jgi:hypothetical protein
MITASALKEKGLHRLSAETFRMVKGREGM